MDKVKQSEILQNSVLNINDCDGNNTEMDSEVMFGYDPTLMVGSVQPKRMSGSDSCD